MALKQVVGAAFETSLYAWQRRPAGDARHNVTAIQPIAPFALGVRFSVKSPPRARRFAETGYGGISGKYRHVLNCRLDGRGGGIRTPDPLLPKQMRYQATLRPDLRIVTQAGFVRHGGRAIPGTKE
jgi:hypothetical protein